VQLLDWTDNKWQILARSSILVAPSLYEAFGIVFLEAGVARMPVIASRVEGIPEVIIDNVTGFLITPRDYISFARKIVELFNDSELLNKMADSNYTRVISNFSLEDKLEEYKQIYEDKFHHSNF
jgi:glycosyltransferase involved in cell wall biosynthesis